MSTNQSSYAMARGIVVNGVGTATSTGTNSWTLVFPGEQFSVQFVTTSTSTTESSNPGACTTVRQETGTFETKQTFQSGEDFGYEGTAGPYTSTTVIVYSRLPNGACDTTGPPRSRMVVITAHATEVFAVL